MYCSTKYRESHKSISQNQFELINLAIIQVLVGGSEIGKLGTMLFMYSPMSWGNICYYVTGSWQCMVQQAQQDKYLKGKLAGLFLIAEKCCCW